MLWPRRRKTPTRANRAQGGDQKLTIAITTGEQNNSMLECFVEVKLVCERDQHESSATVSYARQVMTASEQFTLQNQPSGFRADISHHVADFAW